jgi:thiol-disulfide isomerase/thioredoxin
MIHAIIVSGEPRRKSTSPRSALASGKMIASQNIFREEKNAMSSARQKKRSSSSTLQPVHPQTKPRTKPSQTSAEARATAASRARAPQQASATQGRRIIRRRASRRYAWWLVGAALLVIAGLVGVFVLMSHQTAAPSSTAASDRTGTDSQVLADLALINTTQLSKVGTGNLSSPLKVIADRPMLLGPSGKPAFFYWGAEFCPYCAAERWPVVVALNRFGHFTSLPETTSSSTDAYPNTATLSFYGSVYQSDYLDFTPVEVEDRSSQPLQTPTPEQQQIINTLNPDGSFPFLDIANLYLVRGESYDPSILAGFSQRDIALQLTDPGTAVAKNVLGVANYLTAAICVATADQPASVCRSSFIQFIERQLPRSPYAPHSSSSSFEMPATTGLALAEAQPVWRRRLS